jgi:hypothetical protein
VIGDAPGKDGNASMPEQIKRLNPWRRRRRKKKKKMMMMMTTKTTTKYVQSMVLAVCTVFSVRESC